MNLRKILGSLVVLIAGCSVTREPAYECNFEMTEYYEKGYSNAYYRCVKQSAKTRQQRCKKQTIRQFCPVNPQRGQFVFSKKDNNL